MSLPCHLSYVAFLLLYFKWRESLSLATLDHHLSTHSPYTLALT
jgi:hypothetical protein